jgi:hypothetical protein
MTASAHISITTMLLHALPLPSIALAVSWPSLYHHVKLNLNLIAGLVISSMPRESEIQALKVGPLH